MGLHVKKDRLGNEEIMGDIDDVGSWYNPLSWFSKNAPKAAALKPAISLEARFRKLTAITGVGSYQVFPAKSASAGSFTKIGLIFDEALDVGSYTKGQPSKYKVVVYRLRRRRWNNVKFWDRDTDFVADTAADAEAQAQAYIKNQGWAFQAFSESPS